jgi:hypothetical protein
MERGIRSRGGVGVASSPNLWHPPPPSLSTFLPQDFLEEKHAVTTLPQDPREISQQNQWPSCFGRKTSVRRIE